MTQYASAGFLAERHPLLVEDVTTLAQDSALAAASETADSYLANRYSMPLSSWTDALRRVVCDLAAWDLSGAKAVGSDGTPTLWRLRYLDALAWLKSVRDGEISPPGIVDSGAPSGPEKLVVLVDSDTPRGW